ncbi:MAG: hypothetical protein HY665_09250 [Chloroflexi bacterium]|nr:hypothetical protein [Chloroflexota bacterium]
MVKVKTFTSELKIFHTMDELNQLDGQVNKFISDNGIKKVISVSDVCTTDNSGATIGIIRVLAYEESK